jgi:hypothetical protein
LEKIENKFHYVSKRLFNAITLRRDPQERKMKNKKAPARGRGSF